MTGHPGTQAPSSYASVSSWQRGKEPGTQYSLPFFRQEFRLVGVDLLGYPAAFASCYEANGANACKGLRDVLSRVRVPYSLMLLSTLSAGCLLR